MMRFSNFIAVKLFEHASVACLRVPSPNFRLEAYARCQKPPCQNGNTQENWRTGDSGILKGAGLDQGFHIRADPPGRFWLMHAG